MIVRVRARPTTTLLQSVSCCWRMRLTVGPKRKITKSTACLEHPLLMTAGLKNPSVIDAPGLFFLNPKWVRAPPSMHECCVGRAVNGWIDGWWVGAKEGGWGLSEGGSETRNAIHSCARTRSEQAGRQEGEGE